MSKLVSVQDISCYGQCSLTVALPILSAFGIETAILPSGILSNHTANCFSAFTFLDLTDEMLKIVAQWKKENISFDAIYTGYIGDCRQFDIINDIKNSLLNPGGKLIVDPAMADNGQLYPALDASIVEGMKNIVKEADIILPNLTEAAFLLGEKYKENYSRDEYVSLVKRLAELGPKLVILTGVRKNNGIGAMAYEKATDTITAYYAERQSESYHGTGDIFSSVLIGKLLEGADLASTLKYSCEFIVDCIQETIDDNNHPYGVKFEKVLAKRK